MRDDREFMKFSPWSYVAFQRAQSEDDRVPGEFGHLKALGTLNAEHADRDTYDGEYIVFGLGGEAIGLWRNGAVTKPYEAWKATVSTWMIPQDQKKVELEPPRRFSVIGLDPTKFR